MRDPGRISIIIEKLEELWEEYPDLRLGQLIYFISNGKEDIFYIEDDKWLDKINNLLKKVK